MSADYRRGRAAWFRRLVVFVATLAASAALGARTFDFDGDGRADILWRHGTDGYTVLWRMAGLNAAATGVVLSDPAWVETQVADLNADGRVDLIWRNLRTGATALWLMNGVAPTATTILMSDPAWEVTHTGDLDGDGRADLVWRHAVTGATALWLMNGTQVAGSRIALAEPNWRVTHVADFDGDGRVDLLWQNDVSGEIYLWLMNGLVAKSTGSVVRGADWIVTHAADCNGDRRADLVARNLRTGETAVWLHDGLARIGGGTVFTDKDWLIEYTGDFNGDGKADLLWRHARNGTTAVWLLDGARPVATNTLLSDPAWRVVQVADLDGDGRDDVVWMHPASGGIAAWLMNGTTASATRHLLSDRNWMPTSVAFRGRLLGHSTPAARDAARFLAQATFGASAAEIARTQAMGLDAWLAEQTTLPQTMHLPWVRAEVAAGRADWEVMVPSVWRTWFEGSDQLRQRVAFALSEILVVSLVNDALLGKADAPASYLDLLGQYAFGNFRTLLEAVTLHPAMGHYLDMKGSQRQDDARGVMPNENYARELLQLFSIGTEELNADGSVRKDAGGKPIPTYTETTVQGFARAFTGWTLARQDEAKANKWSCWRWDWPQDDGGRWAEPMQPWSVPACGDPQYLPDFHEYGAKTLLAYPGAPNPTLPAGLAPGEDVRRALDNVFWHPNVGPFVGRRLIQRMVTSNPSPAYVARVAAAFANDGRGTRGDLAAVVRAVLLDPEARSEAMTRSARFGKLREPAIKFAAFHRAFGARSSTGKYYIWNFDDSATSPGQTPLRSPSVFNYFNPADSPPGPIAAAGLVAPEFTLATSSAVAGWGSFSQWGMINQGFTRASSDPVYNFSIAVDYAPWTALTDNPRLVVDRLDELLVGGQLSDALKLALVDAMYKLTISSDPRYAAGDRLDRVRMPLWQILISPEWTVQK